MCELSIDPPSSPSDTTIDNLRPAGHLFPKWLTNESLKVDRSATVFLRLAWGPHILDVHNCKGVLTLFPLVYNWQYEIHATLATQCLLFGGTNMWTSYVPFPLCLQREEWD